MITISNDHHLQWSLSPMITISIHHHLQWSLSPIITISIDQLPLITISIDQHCQDFYLYHWHWLFWRSTDIYVNFQLSNSRFSCKLNCFFLTWNNIVNPHPHPHPNPDVPLNWINNDANELTQQKESEKGKNGMHLLISLSFNMYNI